MKKMPVLFAGHGSPMNALENNMYTDSWKKIGELMPRPKAILAISAHWSTKGLRINDQNEPEQVYDMYGFPDELYALKYPAKGAPDIAKKIENYFGNDIVIDNTWGIDHGMWSILCWMYPKADIPVVQLSVNMDMTAEAHYRIGQKLAHLRDEGILIMASGNVVHNLGRVNWNMETGYGWASDFDLYIKEKITQKNYEAVCNYKAAGDMATLSVPTAEHFYPLLYILGASDENDKLTVFNEDLMMGSLSMTSYMFNQV